MASMMLIITTTFKVRLSKANFHFKYPTKIWNKSLSIIVITGIISVIALVSSFMVKFDYDFSKILATKNLPSYALDKEISKIFNRRFVVPAIAITNKKEESKLIALLNKKMEKK